MAVLAMTASAPVHRTEARAVPRGPPCVVCRCAHLRESGDHLYQTARPGHHSFARPRLSPMPDDPREDEPDESDEAAPSVRPERRAAKRPEVEGRRALPARGDDRGAAGGGGLVRYDPLRAYMAEVARHPVLSREEEHALAVRYTETGDVDAAYKLVASNLRLVVKIAHEYRRTAFQLLDLIQEGNMGLMQAVKKYDPWKGVKLSSYAAWWIRAYIIRFVMENWRMVKLGTTQAQRKLFFNLGREREKLLARGIDPTPQLLAKNLQVEEKDVDEMSATGSRSPGSERARSRRSSPRGCASGSGRRSRISSCWGLPSPSGAELEGRPRDGEDHREPDDGSGPRRELARERRPAERREQAEPEEERAAPGRERGGDEPGQREAAERARERRNPERERGRRRSRGAGSPEREERRRER